MSCENIESLSVKEEEEEEEEEEGEEEGEVRFSAQSESLHG
jgi:hypothetical protein